LPDCCQAHSTGTGSAIEIDDIQTDSDASATVSELHSLSGQSEKNYPVVPACAIGAHFEGITGETFRRIEASFEGALNQ
jgi:hypothetical protein